MCFEACFRAAAVRYVSADPGFGALEIHGRGTDGESGSGYTDLPVGLWPLTCHFRLPTRCRRRLIDLTARFALSRGYHTVVEGISNASHNGPMLTALISDHADRAFAYFLDVSFPETLCRHATKTGTLKYGEAEMRQWYRGLDLLPGGIEHVILAESSLEETVSKIMADAGLGTSP